MLASNSLYFVLFFMTGISDWRRPIHIFHLVLDGCSQWVIGKNVIQYANFIHIAQNSLKFYIYSSKVQRSTVTNNLLIHMRSPTFTTSCKPSSFLSGMNENLLAGKPWSSVKNVVDKVHKHVFGHENTDLKLLLKRKNLCNYSVAKYVGDPISGCTAFWSTAPAQPNRKVSIFSLSKQLNDIVCVDHFYLDSVRLMNCMYLATRYSSVFLVPSATRDYALFGCENCCISHYWMPE